MLKAFREDKVVSDKRILNLERNLLNKQCKQIPQMESKGDLGNVKDNNLLKEKPSEPRKKTCFKCKVCKKLFQTSDELNEHCTMELYCKTCQECIGCYWETNSENCLPDDDDHATHEWQIIQNKCTECGLVSKNDTIHQNHMKKKHGW